MGETVPYCGDPTCDQAHHDFGSAGAVGTMELLTSDGPYRPFAETYVNRGGIPILPYREGLLWVTWEEVRIGDLMHRAGVLIPITGKYGNGAGGGFVVLANRSSDFEIKGGEQVPVVR